MALSTIAFDADDTLWPHEEFFKITEARFMALLAEFADPADLTARLLAAERRNLKRYGYGAKGFTLSMIETAIEITDERVPVRSLREILHAGQEILAHPVTPMPGVAETLAALKGAFRLMIVTKGDLFDQERKVAASGLGDYFDAVEIVSEKDAAAYRRLFARHGTGAECAMMVGNSLKSDIIPALEAGAWGVHIPSAHQWVLDHAEPPVGAARFHVIEAMPELHDVLKVI